MRVLIKRERSMALVMLPDKKISLHRDLCCLLLFFCYFFLFLHNCDLFPCSCAVSLQSNLLSGFTPVTEVQMSLAAVLCAPSSCFNVTETLCVQRRRSVSSKKSKQNKTVCLPREPNEKWNFSCRWMGFQTYSFIVCIVPYCSHVN